jgi:hypothetical protein
MTESTQDEWMPEEVHEHQDREENLEVVNQLKPEISRASGV